MHSNGHGLFQLKCTALPCRFQSRVRSSYIYERGLAYNLQSISALRPKVWFTRGFTTLKVEYQNQNTETVTLLIFRMPATEYSSRNLTVFQLPFNTRFNTQNKQARRCRGLIIQLQGNSFVSITEMWLYHLFIYIKTLHVEVVVYRS